MPVYLDAPGYNPATPASMLLVGVNAGPLLLVEPGNPLNPVTGVPANGTALPDLAALNTALTLGTDPDALTVTNTSAAGSVKTKVERSTKGGLHVMNSQTAQASPYELFDVALGAQRSAFVNAHLNHSYYIGVWFRQTRAAAAAFPGGVPVAALRRTGTYATNDHIVAGGVAGGIPWTLPRTGDSQLVGTRVRQDAGGSMFTAAAANAPYVTPFELQGPLIRLLTWNSARVNNMPSILFYRAYVEDLTVSGRTFAQVAAIDEAEYIAQVRTEGGRYFGDTWNVPSAVLP